jgi:hypothetical protein
MRPKILALLLALSLCGCATIQQHPYATSVVVAVVAGSIAASVHHDDQRGGPAMSNVAGPNCATGACR